MVIHAKDVLCVILGGGQGSRLYPLTKERCKPAVPLFGKYRLIDIPISNCLNSGFNRIYILTQFLSESLNKHVNRTYSMDPFTRGYIDILAAEQAMNDTDWFQGTADAVRRCLKHFNDPAIKYVLILSGDQLYKMNLRELYRYHQERGADVTVACNTVPADEAHHFGIMGVGKNNKIERFVEKPKNLSLVEGLEVKVNNKPFYPGSMGIYLFNKSILTELLSDKDKIDFGKEIIPDAIRSKSTFAYLFKGYWRDIGTIKSFYEENLNLTESMPPLDMFDENWLIFTRPRYLSPAKFEDSEIKKSIVSEGAIIQKAEIKNSIIGLRFRVSNGAKIEDTIAMGSDYYETYDEILNNTKDKKPNLGVGKNCHIKKAILDKNIRIGDNVKILNEDKVEHFDGDNYNIRDGIVIIPKNAVIASNTVI